MHRPTNSIAGLVRLVHPFPSILDGVVVAVIAIVAGGAPLDAVRLGVAMTALQASIGTLNDLVDAPRDAGRKPGKPIPAGTVSIGTARSVAAGAAAVGLVLSALSGAATLALAVVTLGIGYGYDLRLRGTTWSWLPFAVGIPLLPVFGWLGAVGTLPASFRLLIPAAVLAGAALAVANARADYERDLAAGAPSVATALGLQRSWIVHAALLGIVLIVAVGTLAAADVSDIVLGAAFVAVALVTSGMGASRRGGPGVRERAWELEAIGVGVLAAAWVAGVTAAAAIP
jgi:4-hydroxybenzoate polyprenyltransferase